MWIRRSAWGLDLTGGAVKAVRVERSGRQFRVMEAFDLPYSEPGQGTQAVIAGLPSGAEEALMRFLVEAEGRLADPVFVGVHGYGSKQGQIQLPDLPPDRAEEFLEYELTQVLGEPEAWLIRTSHQGRRGRQEETVNFYAQRRDVVDAFVSDLRRCGLPLDGLVPEGVALARYQQVEWSGHDRRLVLHVQRTRTDFLFLTPKGMRTRSVPLGVGGLTGFAAGSRTPPQHEIRGLAQRLANEFERTEIHFFGGRGNFSAERVLMLGEGSSLPTLLNALSKILRREVGVLHMPRCLRLTTSISGGVALDVEQMGTALGLAIAAVDRNPEDFSLTPPPPARRARRRRPAVVYAAIAATFALLFLHMQSWWEVEALRDSHASADHEDHWARGEQLGQEYGIGNQALVGRNDLLWRATALRRQTRFAQRLLSEIADPSTYYRLDKLDVSAGREHDDIELVLSIPRNVPGLEEPVPLVEEWASRRLPIELDEVVHGEGTEQSFSIVIRGTTQRPGSRP